jgi:hypothetical protein
MASKISQIGQFIFAPVEQSAKSAVLFIMLSKFFLAQAVQQLSHFANLLCIAPKRGARFKECSIARSPLFELARVPLGFNHIASIIINVGAERDENCFCALSFSGLCSSSAWTRNPGAFS